MKIQNIVKKAAVIGASGFMLGATAFGALAYDLSTFPDKFIVDGMMDGKITFGANAATSDVMGAVDIAAALQAAAVTTEPIDLPGAAGTVDLQGDTFKVERGTDHLELRENISDVYDTISEGELNALAGGTITTDEGSTNYNQYLRFESSESGNPLQNWGVGYVDNDDNEVSDFMILLKSSNAFFEWEIEFENGLESKVDGNWDLTDLEGETLNVMGTDYTIVDTDMGSTAARSLNIDLMTGQVADVMREGETKTYTIDGVDYEVTLAFVSDPNSGGANPEAKFSVNGETTDALQDGETDTLSGGMQIGVRELMVNAREGIVEFFLGANKIQLTDDNTTDTSFDTSGAVEVNNENIEDASVKIRTNMVQGTGPAVVENDVIEITDIKYRLVADAKLHNDLYIPPGHGIREYLDEPEGMLSPAFDIRYEGLTAPEAHDLTLKSRSDYRYQFTATNIQGDEYSFPFVSNKDGTFKFGDYDTDDFVFVENNAGNIGMDDYFLVSDAPNDKKSVSGVMRFSDLDTSDHTVTFEDIATGEERTISYDATSKTGDFVFGGHTFLVNVTNETTNSELIAVDLNGDGTVTLNDTSKFTSFGGGVIDFAAGVSNSTGGAIPVNASIVGDGLSIISSDDGAYINMSAYFEPSLFDEPATAETLMWKVYSTQVGGDWQVDLSMPQSWQTVLYQDSDYKHGEFILTTPDNNDDHDIGMSTYGVLIDHYNPTGTNDPDELTLTMPKEQKFAQVFVTMGTTTKSTGAYEREVVNPIPVGLAVLDSDAPAVGSENLIVVGGPCANTVAAELLGNPENCAEGFEPGKAMIKSFDTDGKVAILVAGYEALETQGASRVLANYKDYDLSGSEVEVVVTDLNDISVSTVG